MTRLRDPSDVLTDLVRDDDLVLDLPLAPGKRFCEAFHITREDCEHCWVVESAGPAPLAGVVGVSATAERTEYDVRKGALDGDVIVGFVTGVGITRFAGPHRAVPWEVDLRLVEYRPGEG